MPIPISSMVITINPSINPQASLTEPRGQRAMPCNTAKGSMAADGSGVSGAGTRAQRESSSYGP